MELERNFAHGGTGLQAYRLQQVGGGSRQVGKAGNSLPSSYSSFGRAPAFGTFTDNLHH